MNPQFLAPMSDQEDEEFNRYLTKNKLWSLRSAGARAFVYDAWLRAYREEKCGKVY